MKKLMYRLQATMKKKKKKNENEGIEPILISNSILPSGYHALLACAVFVEDAVSLDHS